jgi:hypothetical protein
VAYRGDREYGTIVEVTSHLLGSELTVVASAGSTALSLDDAVDFSTDGRTLQLGVTPPRELDRIVLGANHETTW